MCQRNNYIKRFGKMETNVEDPVEKQIIEDLNKPEMKKRVDKERRKGEKKMELFMKSITDLNAEEKISALCKKNKEFLEEIRNCKASIQLLQRRTVVLEREKDLLQNEQSKAVLARSRLETLCRELQRQNKSIKEESTQKIREEEEKRKEVSLRFQSSLNEVTQNVQQNADKNIKLREDNIEMAQKFHKLCDQFKQREEEVIRLTKQMDLEKQLAEATVKRSECQLNAERELWNKEKEFHKTQMKANDMERINKLEKECGAWKERWQQAQLNFNRVISENQTLEKEMTSRNKKLDKLADLCRSIQDERTAYLKQLKENGLTPVALPEKPIAPPVPVLPPPAANTTNKKQQKVTKKEKKLEQLKNEMKVLKMHLSDSENSVQGKLDSSNDTTSPATITDVPQNENDTNSAIKNQVQSENTGNTKTELNSGNETDKSVVSICSDVNTDEKAKQPITKPEE
ncbi:uncharacterized protein CBL_09220 [Carabus blaptoides fortunei]